MKINIKPNEILVKETTRTPAEVELLELLSYIADLRIECLRKTLRDTKASADQVSFVEGLAVRELLQSKKLYKIMKKGQELMARPIIEGRL